MKRRLQDFASCRKRWREREREKKKKREGENKKKRKGDSKSTISRYHVVIMAVFVKACGAGG